MVITVVWNTISTDKFLEAKVKILTEEENRGNNKDQRKSNIKK